MTLLRWEKEDQASDSTFYQLSGIDIEIDYCETIFI